MGLELKKGGFRNFYAYYPEMEMHSPYRRYSVIILRDSSTKKSVQELIAAWGLADFAQKESCVLAFPNPPKEGWNSVEPETLAEKLRDIQNKMCEPEGYFFACDDNGIPLLECMLNRWHLMNDTRYYVGIGEGAKAACTMALEAPKEVAAVLCCTEGKYKGLKALLKDLDEIKMPYRNLLMNGGTLHFASVYGNFMKQLRRINTGKYGETAERMDFAGVKFDAYLEDRRLGDQRKMKHTWFVHVPTSVRKALGGKQAGRVPMMVFFHGGSDSPMEAAEMSKFHEIGEKEGFITVYPWGSDTASWNCNYTKNGCNDVAYVKALIGWMKENYPVDESRVYLSGFSNGAAMAQIYAMEYPEEIAGICHIDSNWPGHRLGLANIQPEEVEAFRRAWKKKKKYDYLMPVWYIYGTGEPSFPVYKGCSQQLQYDFWKEYNHIPIQETPERENMHPCGCGVPGEECEMLVPSMKWPKHVYQVNRFFSEKDHWNLYNYVAMHDKGHEVAPSDAKLGWEYVKQFRRGADGALF